MNGALISQLETVATTIDTALQMARLVDDPNGAECRKLLCNLYGLIWSEAVYDPMNESTQKYSGQLLPIIRRLNEILKFKL